MENLTLRDYQQAALNSVIEEYQKGINGQLIVLPTGAGKTIIMAAIAKHFNSRVLILAHRKELIQQTRDKIELFWPNADIGICKASQKQYSNQIVVGSIQSCAQPERLAELQKQNFDILMIDEAHHVAAGSYLEIINALGFKNGPKLLIGVTATPDRADKKQIGNTFEKIIYSQSIASLIQQGYLSQVVGRNLLTRTSLKGVKSHDGDFIATQLADAVNKPERNEFISSKYKEHAIGRKAIAFCVDVKHCKDLASTLKKMDSRQLLFGEV